MEQRLKREMDGRKVTDWLVADHSAFDKVGFTKWHAMVNWCADYNGLGR